MMDRKSGVLLPIFSLPGPYGCGTFSREAKEVIDCFAACGFRLWQVLPFGVTDSYHSPYMSLSSFGGNPYFISPDTLYEKGLVTKEELLSQRVEDPYLCDYAFLEKNRLPFLKKAASRVKDRGKIDAFLAENPLVAKTCLFFALKEKNGGQPWTKWKDLTPDEDALFAWQFIQYEFHTQWEEIHAYALEKGISMIGDLPFYVSHDSFDVWSAPEDFLLNEDFSPKKVAGVPPDYFSPDGQMWGNPLYRWDKMEKDGFSLWKERLSYQLTLFDGIRIDHFRALSAYFAIPADAESAKEGEWVEGPGKAFIDAIAPLTKEKMILAEDLGTIDRKVVDLLSYAGYPGMAVFQFGFDGDPLSPHLPHNFKENQVAYSGTHDNNTLLGFYFEESEDVRNTAKEYLGASSDLVKETLRALFRSKAGSVIFPLQDLLFYGADTRINTPGKAQGNWQCRFTKEQILSLDAKTYAGWNRMFAR